ncbi:hypothetical protein ECNE098_4450, partial [Escherichia coli NE098]
WRLR